jgi:Tfp pilus assembly protein PilN
VIRSNLATRPFYNERAVNFWLAVLAVVVLVATVVNVARVRFDSGSNTELATQASQDEKRAADLRASAAKLRASVDARQVDAVSVDARQANDLIDRRTFSWTALFNQFETTLPDNVRVTSVRPTLDRERRILLTVAVLARSVNDIEQFMEQLDATGAFKDLRSAQERITDDDQIESVLEMVYVPRAGAS